MLGASRTPAQTPGSPPANAGFAVGMTVQRLQDDFGVGGLIASPAFFNGLARLSAVGGVAWYPYGRTLSGDQDWIPFGHMRIVVESGPHVGQAPLRLYGFGGEILAFQPRRLSDDRVSVGGVGGFGFEFFGPAVNGSAPMSYFIEIGGAGSGARATNLAGRPTLLNGLLIQAGVRFYP